MITFETELIAVNKVRVTVDVCDKVITFDWNQPTHSAGDAAPMNLGGLGGFPGTLGGPQGGLGFPGTFGGPAVDADKVTLYFFTRLSHPGVSVTVDSCLQ